jgi:hypothetical protein
VLTGLPINAYDPRWLEGREELYVKHVLCPKMEKYPFTHSSDVIAYVLNSPIQMLSNFDRSYRLLSLEP